MLSILPHAAVMMDSTLPLVNSALHHPRLSTIPFLPYDTSLVDDEKQHQQHECDMPPSKRRRVGGERKAACPRSSIDTASICSSSPPSSSSAPSSPTRPLSWQSLPIVLIALSFSHLDLSSLLRASSTCHSWHNALSQPDTWQHLTVVIEDDTSPIRVCDFTFPSSPSTIRPVHHQSEGDLTPHLAWPLDHCLPSLLPLRHLLINTDNESFLPSFTFLSTLTSLRTLTLHLSLTRYRALHPLLPTLHLPSLTSFTLLLDIRFTDLSHLTLDLFSLPPHLPLHLHLHLRSFRAHWQDDWVDTIRQWRGIEGLDLSMKQWASLSEDHLRLLLQGEGEEEEEGGKVQSAYPHLHSLSLSGQSHLTTDFLSLVPSYIPSLTTLDLTNCMGIDHTALPHLSTLPSLHTLHLTLHEHIPNPPLLTFLSSTPLHHLTLSAKSQDRRLVSYCRVVELPLPRSVMKLTVERSVRLRVRGEAGMEGMRVMEWEGGGEEGVVGWVMKREGVREVRMRVEWEGETGQEGGGKEEGKDEGEGRHGKEKWEEMEQALKEITRGERTGGHNLRLVRVNASDARMRHWRRLAPHICFAPADDVTVDQTSAVAAHAD